ncbi:uncharacterized protein AB9W97_001672 isoform 2-T2 [Spinachia spinachia]
MLTRNFLLLFALVLLGEADLHSNDNEIEVQSTEKESTSDEAPTESKNAISPHHPAANQVSAPEPAAASVEEEDNEPSKEGGNKKFEPRSAEPPRTAHQAQRSTLMITNQSPAQSQPIIPQVKSLVRNQKPKRRSRINRL